MSFGASVEPREQEGDQWHAQVSNPAPNVLWARLGGWATTAAFKFLQDGFDRLLAAGQGPLEVFHDWSELRGYDPDARAQYLVWATQHPTQVKKVHILIVARVVQTGLTVANVALGGYVKTYADRAAWEAERDRATALANGGR